MHVPDHAILSDRGPVGINWKASGYGPRLADLGYLMWGTFHDQESVGAVVCAYREHVDLTPDELDRFEPPEYFRKSAELFRPALAR